MKPHAICDHPASYDAGLCCGKTPCTLRSVSVGRVADQFMELAPASAYERQAQADGAMAERRRVVAYLRAEAPASSCRLAMLHVADAIERGEHAADPLIDRPSSDPVKDGSTAR